MMSRLAARRKALQPRFPETREETGFLRMHVTQRADALGDLHIPAFPFADLAQILEQCNAPRASATSGTFVAVDPPAFDPDPHPRLRSVCLPLEPFHAICVIRAMLNGDSGRR